MKKIVIILVITINTVFSLISQYPTIEFIGGMFANLDELNQTLIIQTLAGQLLNSKKLTNLEYQSLITNWTNNSVRVHFPGLNDRKAGSTQFNSTIGGHGVFIYDPSLQLHIYNGPFYQTSSNMKSTIPENISGQHIYTSETGISVSSTIPADSKVIINSAGTVRLKTGFHAKPGSSIRITSEK